MIVGVFYYVESGLRITSAQIGNPTTAERQRKKTAAKIRRSLFFRMRFVRVSEDILVFAKGKQNQIQNANKICEST